MSNNQKLSNEEFILTFGYGNRKNYDQFLDYLKKYNVTCVIDVRLSPRAWSRRWYGDKIREVCESNNVEYISKTALGNISGKKSWIPPDEEEANAALKEVAELTQKGTVLLLCAEMNPHRCHRLEVANELTELVSSSVKHLE